MRKLTYEFVKSEFEKRGYTLLSKEYVNSKQILDCICSNGHKHLINYNNFKTGYKCLCCTGKNSPSIEFISKEFEKEGYVLLSKKYVNNKTDLNYICPNGHNGKIRWNNWTSGSRCLHCYRTQYTIDDIRQAFESEEYILLTTKYKTSADKLDFICPIGHRHSITWSSWLWQGSRCFVCKYISFSGPANPNWRGGIDCEPYCINWVDEFKDYIKERDDYSCLNPNCFGNSGILCVHHVNYDKKYCEPENLITLCNSCNSRANKDREWHKSWYQAIIHRRYGYNYDRHNNSRQI